MLQIQTRLPPWSAGSRKQEQNEGRRELRRQGERSKASHNRGAAQASKDD